MKQLRVEKENKKQGLVTEFVSNIKKRSDSRKKKQATLKNECEKDLADARKRLMTVKKSLFDCRNKLRQIKSRVNRGIEDSKVEMSEARGEMDRHLAACLAKTRRHGNNRAKRDSLFQGLADLFKRNY